MRIATITVAGGEPFVALAVGSAVADLHRAAERLGHGDAASLPGDLLGIIEAGPDAWAAAEALDEALAASSFASDGQGDWWWPASEVRFEVPLTPRKNPWVIGANYF